MAHEGDVAQVESVQEPAMIGIDQQQLTVRAPDVGRQPGPAAPLTATNLAIRASDASDKANRLCNR